MTTARDCNGCRWFYYTKRVQLCDKYGRAYCSSRLVSKEHDPGRCWEAPKKKETDSHG